MNELELKKQVAEAIATIGQNHFGPSKYAEMVVSLADPNHLALSLFSRIMPTRQANPGDTTVKRIRRGRYPVFSMVPGTAHLVGQVSYLDTYNWVFDRLITGARESTWNLRDNPLVSTAKLRSDMQADLVDNLVGRVFDLLSTVWNTSDTPNNYLQTAALTFSQLDTIMENVIDVNGDVAAIMGTRKALLPIYNFAGFREYTVTGGSTPTAFEIPGVLEERWRTNKVSTYNGAPLIEIPNVYSNSYPSLRNKLIPDDKIIVVGKDAGEILLYGGFETQEYTDFTIQPADYQVHGWQAYGMVVTDVEAIGVIRKI